ncbi:MAG: hypothetical protein NTZ56_04025 [Acidobacteria bacterium]|nr:hypothetical protein [Acidobacteriota bacterium]
MPSWAEWAGFGISIVGFGITIWQVLDAKRAARAAQSAAEMAREATVRAREQILRDQAIAQLERATQLLRGMKLLHRRKQWDLALRDSDQASEAIQAFRHAVFGLPLQDDVVIQACINDLVSMRELVEEKADGNHESSPPYLNSILDELIGKLMGVLAGCRRQERI